MKTIITIALLAILGSADAALRGTAARQLSSSCGWYDPTCGHGILTKHNALSNAVTALGSCVVNTAQCIEGCIDDSAEKKQLQDAQNAAAHVNNVLNFLRTTVVPAAQRSLKNATDARHAYVLQAGDKKKECRWDGGTYNTTCALNKYDAVRYGAAVKTSQRVLKKLDCVENYYADSNNHVHVKPGSQQTGHLHYEQTSTSDECFAGCSGNAACAYANWDVMHNCNWYTANLRCTPLMPRTDTSHFETTFELYVKSHTAMINRLDYMVKQAESEFDGYTKQLKSLKVQARNVAGQITTAKAVLRNNKCHTLITRFGDLEKAMKDVADAIDKWAAEHECELIDAGFTVAKIGVQAAVEVLFEEFLAPLQALPMCAELEEEEAEHAEEKVAETAANTVSRDSKHGKAIAICSYVFKLKASAERKSAPSIKTLADCAVAMVGVVNDDIIQKLSPGHAHASVAGLDFGSKKGIDLAVYFTEKAANMFCGQFGTELVGVAEDMIMCNSNLGPNGKNCGEVLGTKKSVCDMYQHIF